MHSKPKKLKIINLRGQQRRDFARFLMGKRWRQEMTMRDNREMREMATELPLSAGKLIRQFTEVGKGTPIDPNPEHDATACI